MMSEVNLLNAALFQAAWFAVITAAFAIVGAANAGNLRPAMGRAVDSRV